MRIKTYLSLNVQKYFKERKFNIHIFITQKSKYFNDQHSFQIFLKVTSKLLLRVLYFLNGNPLVFNLNTS